ncbi:hypothetical protein SAPIO_CDS9873 [Scedosporium apiospermum]|uniref:Tse2 ADP-ribosyltransferase toxin domain-containing protein n=1 Tax=Pseudallescheria apiosperma TaxID=563466 RepID=A0A084FVU7_PSEDA|nr:uncharacterized protein SAPIO_CDS9873 [Scedosporium apiospermum]KEZ39209.1 hypothetical protein SAPIO_CDS9873 [Scedosporium apiospermum]
MQPNTFSMQEIIRQNYDEAIEREEEGGSAETPFVFTIPKGTPIPGHLILINEYLARFSLQPSRAMSLKELNRSLDEFYDKNAIKETPGDWIDGHPYEDALDEGLDETWMAK